MSLTLIMEGSGKLAGISGCRVRFESGCWGAQRHWRTRKEKAKMENIEDDILSSAEGEDDAIDRFNALTQANQETMIEGGCIRSQSRHDKK